MKDAMPFPKLLRRIFSSLAAIAAVSVIFGAKAFESEHQSAPTAQVAMVHGEKTPTP